MILADCYTGRKDVYEHFDILAICEQKGDPTTPRGHEYL